MSKKRSVTDSLWLIALPLGFMNWAVFLFLGLRGKCAKYFYISFFYFILFIFPLFGAFMPSLGKTSIGTAFGLLMLLGYFFGIIYGLLIREPYLDRLNLLDVVNTDSVADTKSLYRTSTLELSKLPLKESTEEKVTAEPTKQRTYTKTYTKPATRTTNTDTNNTVRTSGVTRTSTTVTSSSVSGSGNGQNSTTNVKTTIEINPDNSNTATREMAMSAMNDINQTIRNSFQDINSENFSDTMMENFSRSFDNFDKNMDRMMNNFEQDQENNINKKFSESRITSETSSNNSDAFSGNSENNTGADLKTEQAEQAVSLNKVPDNLKILDINNANEEELAGLPGFNLILAKKLINERNARNGFKNIFEVKKILNLDLSPEMDSELKKRTQFGTIEKAEQTSSNKKRVIDF